MLFLLFSIGRKHYALKADQVIEVLPNLTVDDLDPPSGPSPPDGYAGMINCRGSQLPVIDLCQLFNNTPCPNVISSRIILINGAFHEGNLQTIGLLAEKITETKTIKSIGETSPTSPQFKHLVESQLSEPNAAVTLFDPESSLSAFLNQLAHIM